MKLGGAAGDLLAGRRGLILGVSHRRSVGFVCASRFSEWGACLALSSRGHLGSAGPALAKELGALSLTIDAEQESTFEEGLRTVEKELGGLDFLVHTMVGAPADALRRSVVELTQSEFGQAMDVGVRSLLVALRYSAPLLRCSPAPRVIVLTSSGADFAIPGYHLVGMVKAALNAAVRYAAADLGRDGVLCNALCFSMVPTETACRVIGEEVTERTVSHLARRSMTGTAVGLDEVASVAAFLVSEACRGITGQVITVDNGFSRSYF